MGGASFHSRGGIFASKQISFTFTNLLFNMKYLSMGSTWLIVVIIGAIFSFYWFSVRPEQIKKECYKKSSLDYYFSYDDCLMRSGIQ